jgi:kynurenine formamidase
VPQLLGIFPGLTKQELPDGEGWAIESVELITHNGTHLDAPYHFASTMNHGEPAITIDEVPLEWCFQPGVKLDFRHYPDGYVVTANDVEAELQRIHHELKPLEIIVVNTHAGARYGEEDYVNSGCGMVVKPRCICWSEVCGLPAPTHGAGTRPSRIPRKSIGRPGTPL